MSFEQELLAERSLAKFSNQSRVSILSSPMRSSVKFFKGKSGFDSEYKGDDFEIPTGVIVKRVLGGAVPLSVVVLEMHGAMTIVEIVDAHQGFKLVTDNITTRKPRTLLLGAVIRQVPRESKRIENYKYSV